MFRLPATRPEFWAVKIAGNRARDLRVLDALREAGWRSLIVWECAMRGPARRPIEEVVGRVKSFVGQEAQSGELMGAW